MSDVKQEVTEPDAFVRVLPGAGATAPFRNAVLLVASAAADAIRAARACSGPRLMNGPVVLVVPKPGRPGEPVGLYPGSRRLPPDLAAIVGRSRLALRQAGLEPAVLSVPFLDSENGATRTRRIVTALVEASRSFRASKLVVDELAYWEPETERVAAGLRSAAEVGRLGRTELVVTGLGTVRRWPSARPTEQSRSTEQSRPAPSRTDPKPTIPVSRTEPDRLTFA
jgi:hypothetical protein